MDPIKLQRQKELSNRYGKLIARAWADEEFKGKLLADPATAFAEFDIEIPEGVELRVVEDTYQVTHFILPPKPPEMEQLHLEKLRFEVLDCPCTHCHDRGNSTCSRCGVCLTLFGGIEE